MTIPQDLKTTIVITANDEYVKEWNFNLRRFREPRKVALRVGISSQEFFPYATLLSGLARARYGNPPASASAFRGLVIYGQAHILSLEQKPFVDR
jgi:hypothetical protein